MFSHRCGQSAFGKYMSQSSEHQTPTRNRPLECIGSSTRKDLIRHLSGDGSKIREQPNSSVGGICKSASWHVEFYVQLDGNTYMKSLL